MLLILLVFQAFLEGPGLPPAALTTVVPTLDADPYVDFVVVQGFAALRAKFFRH
jgi:hypothetical protein